MIVGDHWPTRRQHLSSAFPCYREHRHRQGSIIATKSITMTTIIASADTSKLPHLANDFFSTPAFAVSPRKLQPSDVSKTLPWSFVKADRADWRTLLSESPKASRSFCTTIGGPFADGAQCVSGTIADLGLRVLQRLRQLRHGFCCLFAHGP